jgi:hypothetical protein
MARSHVFTRRRASQVNRHRVLDSYDGHTSRARQTGHSQTHRKRQPGGGRPRRAFDGRPERCGAAALIDRQRLYMISAKS